MQQFKIALILVVCGLCTASVAAGDCSDDGYYVDQNDCQKYFQCVEGRRYNFQCSGELKFDTNSFTCVWPKDANCVNSGIKQTTRKPNTSPTPAVLTTDCPKGDGYWVVENDCSRFYGCSGGIRHYYDCPAGLKYNSGSHTCVEPAAAKC